MVTGPVVIKQTINAPSEKVWNALTDYNEMKQWYFDIPGFKPEEGYEFTFKGGRDNREYLHLCKITEVIPGKKLSHSWEYAGYEGLSFVTFELFPDGDKTEVILTHRDLDTFPKDNEDFAAANFIEGWNYILGTSLKEYLEKNYSQAPEAL